jgi:hypothetical protein
MVRNMHFLFVSLVLSTWCLTNTAVRAAEFYAVVEQDGTVVLCLSKGALLFADRCEGSGRLSIVQPIKEGAVVWRTATGTVTLENDSPNPECALGRAKWDRKSEEVISTGRKITKADRSDLLKRLKILLLKDADVVEEDITAFAVDLDNDGNQEIVFVASNLQRVADHYSDDSKSSKSIPYFVYGGILANDTQVPQLFYNGGGNYVGATDNFGDVTIKGVVPIAPGAGEIALLVNPGKSEGTQMLVRYRRGLAQQIDTIGFVCN